MPKPKQKKPSPAVTKAAKDLRKGSSDAGLAMEELRRIEELEKKNAALKKAKKPKKR